MRRKILNLLTFLAFTACTGVTLVLYLFFYYGRGLPDYEYLRDYEPFVLNRLYTAEGEVLYEYAREKRIFVPLHAIPERVISAFLAAEDKNFYYHFGLDFLGITRAVLFNTIMRNWANSPGGASTITQQVAKNFLLSNERSFSRKAREAILAIRLEYTLPKDRILELYLNQIYLGYGAYGIAAASLEYFNRDLAELTNEEAAFLAALPKAPTRLSQGNLERLKERRDWVLDRMVAIQSLNESQAKEAKDKPIVLKAHQSWVVKADYFVDEVRRKIPEVLKVRDYQRGGLSIKTTIEPEIQQIADAALKKGLIDYDRRHGWRGPIHRLSWGKDEWHTALKEIPKPNGLGEWTYGVILEASKERAIIGLINGHKGEIPLSNLLWARPWMAKQTVGQEPREVTDVLKEGDVVIVSKTNKDEIYQLEQIPDVNGAVVVIDPHSGRILAMSGGYQYDLNQFNCATQGMRQPGSAFKPFVYATALKRGFTPQTMILDAPISVSLGRGLGMYQPRNYTRQYYGSCPLRVGLEQSRNVMTIRLAQKIGMKGIKKTAQAFGVYTDLPNQLAMALGAGETTVLKLTAAYAMIANGGYKITPRVIDSIQDRYGNTLYQADNTHESIIPQKANQDMISMLRGVVERGTAKRLKRLNLPLAGKTGSTNDYKDAWFVGFSPDLVVGVFVGFLTPKSLGEGETGGRAAVPIFEYFMEKVYENRPKVEFSQVVPPVEEQTQATTNLDIMTDFLLSEEGLMPISHGETKVKNE